MIAENIGKYMKENGIKQTYVADKAGMTKQALSESLNGNRKLAADEYVAICTALNVSTDKFTQIESETVRA